MPNAFDDLFIKRQIRNGIRVGNIVDVAEGKPDCFRGKTQDRLGESFGAVFFEAKVEALYFMSMEFQGRRKVGHPQGSDWVRKLFHIGGNQQNAHK